MKHWLIVAGVLVVALGGLQWFRSYEDSLGSVNISLDPAARAEIVQQLGEDPGSPKTVKSFQASYHGKLKMGNYAVVPHAGSDYDNSSTGLIVGANPTTLSIRLDYSDAKLKSFVSGESEAINQAFNAKYPAVSIGYSLQKITLYGRGDWAGALVVPGAANQDSLRAIFQKVNSQWKIVTDPPVISIGTPVYPNIPRDIIVKVNILN